MFRTICKDVIGPITIIVPGKEKKRETSDGSSTVCKVIKTIISIGKEGVKR